MKSLVKRVSRLEEALRRTEDELLILIGDSEDELEEKFQKCVADGRAEGKLIVLVRDSF